MDSHHRWVVSLLHALLGGFYELKPMSTPHYTQL